MSQQLATLTSSSRRNFGIGTVILRLSSVAYFERSDDLTRRLYAAQEVARHVQTYNCYVHVPSSMTPHIRVVAAASREQNTQNKSNQQDEKSVFDLVDVYDET